ncbi:tetratricopeptide repeat protein [bacterium]|nr:tetratricopeptide repeat protein [bacterium]
MKTVLDKIRYAYLPLIILVVFIMADCAHIPGSSEAEIYNSYKLAEDYLRKQKFDQAIGEYREIVNNYPESQYADDAYFKLGYIHCVKGDYKLANTYFTIVLDKYSKSNWAFDAQTWANLTGGILSCTDKISDAEKKLGTYNGNKNTKDDELTDKVEQLKQENKELRERIEELERLIGELE